MLCTIGVKSSVCKATNELDIFLEGCLKGRLTRMSKPRGKTSTRRILLMHSAACNFILRWHKVTELFVQGEAHPKLEYQRDYCRGKCRCPFVGSPSTLETNGYNAVSSNSLKTGLDDLLSVIKRFMKIMLASIRFITTFHKRYKPDISFCLKLISKTYIPHHSQLSTRTRT